MRSRPELVLSFCTGLSVGVILYAYTPEIIRTSNTQPPPNLTPVSKRIDTSAQPSAQQLAGLKQAGYNLVVKLAPPHTPGSIKANIDQGYENATSIWSPDPHWLEFANKVIARHQIEFDPL